MAFVSNDLQHMTSNSMISLGVCRQGQLEHTTDLACTGSKVHRVFADFMEQLVQFGRGKSCERRFVPFKKVVKGIGIEELLPPEIFSNFSTSQQIYRALENSGQRKRLLEKLPEVAPSRNKERVLGALVQHHLSLGKKKLRLTLQSDGINGCQKVYPTKEFYFSKMKDLHNKHCPRLDAHMGCGDLHEMTSFIKKFQDSTQEYACFMVLHRRHWVSLFAKKTGQNVSLCMLDSLGESSFSSPVLSEISKFKEIKHIYSCSLVRQRFGVTCGFFALRDCATFLKALRADPEQASASFFPIIKLAFAEFSASSLPSLVHETLIKKMYSGSIVGHISRDSTPIESREKALKKKAKPKQAKKRGRPRKGEVREKEEKRLEKQPRMSQEERLADLPKSCDIGAKRE